ncbi:hypothetical protein PINS_up014225 [Pythium insidiosum]|nr:hypothetical protein PINS_up014225 [Pythium insidiosum]
MAAELRRQVQLLQAEVFRLRNPGLSESELRLATVGTNLIGMAGDYDTYGNLRSRAETAENEVARLMAELKRNRSQLDHLKEEMIAAQAERDYLKLVVEDSGGMNGSEGGPTAPGEREKTSNVLKDQLRQICELQEKLREAERERDRALMSNSTSSRGMPFSARSARRSSPTVSLTVEPFDGPELTVDTDLIARAEKEIEREAELLRKLQSADDDTTMDDAENVDNGLVDAEEKSDGEGASFADGDVETADEDDESSKALALNLQMSEEEADRERVFQRRQRHLGESVEDLAHDISLKEQLVQNIRRAQDNYERLRSFYEQKIEQMTAEVRVVQVDRDRLIEEIEQIETKMRTSGDVGGQGSGRLAKLSSELKDKEAELVSLKKKQNDMNRFMNQKKKNEMQLRVLTAEISTMKRQKVELMKKMQEERKRYEEEANRRQREIMSLKKSQQKDKQRILQLGSQKEAQERVLKRKMEEINATKARLKQQQQLQAQARRSNAAHGRNRVANRDTKWLSDEVRRRAEEQQKLEQLQKNEKTCAVRWRRCTQRKKRSKPKCESKLFQLKATFVMFSSHR